MLRAFDASVFDLDGVVTFTASVHAAAWKQLFDAFLHDRARVRDERFRAFTMEDYRTFVDGRPRLDGVRTFLAARGIVIPEGTPADPLDAHTMMALAARKDALFRERLQRVGIDVDSAAISFIRSLRRFGIRVGAASSSRNAAAVLERAGIEDLFDARVDGILSDQLHLRGKPAPDLFLTCLDRLGTPNPRRAMVAEDAIVGVEAGRAARFGLVIGVDRAGHARSLRDHGADWVIGGFDEISVAAINDWFARDRT